MKCVTFTISSGSRSGRLHRHDNCATLSGCTPLKDVLHTNYINPSCPGADKVYNLASSCLLGQPLEHSDTFQQFAAMVHQPAQESAGLKQQLWERV